MQAGPDIRDQLSETLLKAMNTSLGVTKLHSPSEDLDGVSDRPFRASYITPGEGVFPEAKIILIETKAISLA